MVHFFTGYALAAGAFEWLPNRAKVEPQMDRLHSAPLNQLKTMGHVVRLATEAQGDAHSIWIDPKTGDLTGAADKRENGSAAGY